ncbi:hypothetical protein WCT98_07490 [Pectobacterium brasiliense]|uniref:hypothetical protein n=1 Tax=Pectobacterium brasiliense TaxID=180957 RepID=UPI00301ABA75
MSSINLPWSLDNWKKSTNESFFLMEEHQFYAQNLFFLKKFTIGPYQFFFDSTAKGDSVQTLITVRVKFYSVNQEKKEEYETLHFNANIGDEIAGLLSLSLGVKIFYAGISRTISPLYEKYKFSHDDPYGVPKIPNKFNPPPLSITESLPVLPSLNKDIYGNESIKRLDNLIKASAIQYKGFIRAACLYRDALEMVDYDPNLSWVLMVSAVETAAVLEKNQNSSAIETFELGSPELFSLLKSNNNENLLDDAALLIAPTLKATEKFINFCIKYFPVQPTHRAKDDNLRIDWRPENMKKILSVIYNYRSSYLHSGKRFPSIMSSSPIGDEEMPSIVREKDYLNRIWKRKEVPINLHIFNYMVQNMLMNWCGSFSNDVD